MDINIQKNKLFQLISSFYQAGGVTIQLPQGAAHISFYQESPHQNSPFAFAPLYGSYYKVVASGISSERGEELHLGVEANGISEEFVIPLGDKEMFGAGLLPYFGGNWFRRMGCVSSLSAATGFGSKYLLAKRYEEKASDPFISSFTHDDMQFLTEERYGSYVPLAETLGSLVAGYFVCKKYTPPPSSPDADKESPEAKPKEEQPEVHERSRWWIPLGVAAIVVGAAIALADGPEPGPTDLLGVPIVKWGWAAL